MKFKIPKLNRSEQVWGYMFIAPQFIGLLAFILIPALLSLYISFFEWDFIKTPKWVGFSNYKTIFSDPLTFKVLKNTALFIAGNIPLNICLALILAIVLSGKIKGLLFYRMAFFMPTITSTVAVSMIWLYLYNPDIGLINTVLSIAGIHGPGWVSDTTWVIPSIIIVAVYQGVGYNIVIFMAGLKGIPESFYEAASIDGANNWTCFKKITLPMLTPTIFFIVTMMLINGFSVFNEVYMMTRGGPADASNVIVLDIYNMAFRYFKMGPAAVLSWVLFIIIFIVTLVQFKFSNRWVNYDV